MPSRLIEVELRVADLERALRFYRDLVGLPLGPVESHEGEDVRHVHATWGDWDERGEFLMLNLYPVGDAELSQATIGFVVDNLDAVHARLVSSGTVVMRAPHRRPWGASATYKDPDGNTLSLSERPARQT